MTVYFARAGQTGPIKIGFTFGEVAERVAELQCGCPWPITVLHEMPGGIEAEAFLHRQLSDHRMCGEWFAPAEQVEALVQRAIDGALEIPERVTTVIDRAISLAGSEQKLADRVGFSQPAINKAKKRGRASAELAVAIDTAMAPDVTKSDLRPDLWPAEAAEPAEVA